MNAFDGIPFVVGDVRGVRSWDVDQLGRLRSPQKQTIWTPGENLAACHKGSIYGRLTFPSLPDISYQMEPDGTVTVVQRDRPKPEPESSPVESPPHKPADCACGFYAYSNGFNEYAAGDSRITGVVQGYGETQLGTRGFRSQKARVLALTRPKVKKSSKRSNRMVNVFGDWVARLESNYPEVAFFDNYDLMLAEFPVDTTDITPDSDPDFWTRSA